MENPFSAILFSSPFQSSIDSLKHLLLALAEACGVLAVSSSWAAFGSKPIEQGMRGGKAAGFGTRSFKLLRREPSARRAFHSKSRSYSGLGISLVSINRDPPPSKWPRPSPLALCPGVGICISLYALGGSKPQKLHNVAHSAHSAWKTFRVSKGLCLP